MSPLRFGSEVEVMQHALELARRGAGRVEPNPMVGAVIVDDELRQLGGGWHQAYGGPHAEVHALSEAGAAARGATMFVTLEPCCHFGKTPPCSRALIAAGIRRVVVAQTDPAAHVNGNGIAELREAGLQVDVGLLEAEASRLTAPFVMLMTQGRPWVHAKWALTLDGKIAARTGHSQWISGPESRAIVHELRGRMDAIVVGINTVLADDPQLTARPPGPRLAARVVIDSRCRLPPGSQLAQTARDAPVVCVTCDSAPPTARQCLEALGVEVLVMPPNAAGHPDPAQWLQEFGRRKWTHLLVEGGGELLGDLFDHNVIDEVHAFIAPKLVGGRSAVPALGGLGRETIPAEGLFDCEIRMVGEDVYVHGRTRSG